MAEKARVHHLAMAISMKRPRPVESRQQASSSYSARCCHHVPLLVWLCSLLAAPAAALVVPLGTGSDSPRRPTVRPRPSLPLSTTALHSSASTSTSHTTESSLSSLASLTVKELRELVKQRSSEERGILSRLKRKQDLLDYLLVTTNDTTVAETTMEAAAMAVEPQAPKSTATAADSSAIDTSSVIQKQPTKLPPLAIMLTDPKPAAKATPKDIIMQDVFRRYPPVRDETELLWQRQQQQLEVATAAAKGTDTTTDEFSETGADVRQVYHPLLRACRNISSSSDMDLVFVGTASCTPGVTRGVSRTALRLNWKRRAALLYNTESGRLEPPKFAEQCFQGGTWLFDVGECTQLQVQRTNCIRPSKITKIFLTHAHGDHSFGLPGLLCLMGQDRDRDSNCPPIDIYGPEGLRMWLRVAIRYSVSRIVPPYRVHEIMNVPMAPEWEYSSRAHRFFRRVFTGDEGNKPWVPKGLAGEDGINWISQAKRLDLEPSSMYGEIEGGRDIYPEYNHPMSVGGAPVWQVEDEEDVKVYAAPMSHGIPCVGYVVEELPRPGRLRNELVEPMVKRNFAALKEAGFRAPLKAMAVIKNLPEGSAFTFPDGTVVTQEEALEPPRPGRKVVICGDTADSRALLKLAENADVVIHEATNSYLTGVDKDTSLREVTRDAVLHGHSTPHIAGLFAKATKAKRLVLNHFSARYKGDSSADSLSIMMRIERQAIKTAGLDETQVAAAWDLMVLPVPRQK